MEPFISYKDEIVNSINDVKEQQVITNDFLDDLINPKEIENKQDDKELENSETEEEEIQSLDTLKEDVSEELKEEFSTLSFTESEDFYVLIDQNNEIIENLERLNKNNIENAWLISLTIVIALGFHYFINQFSKW